MCTFYSFKPAPWAVLKTTSKRDRMHLGKILEPWVPTQYIEQAIEDTIEPAEVITVVIWEEAHPHDRIWKVSWLWDGLALLCKDNKADLWSTVARPFCISQKCKVMSSHADNWEASSSISISWDGGSHRHKLRQTWWEVHSWLVESTLRAQR